MNAETLLFALLRKEVCGEHPDDNFIHALAEKAEALFTLSKSHDMAHIVGHSLKQLGIPLQEQTAQQYQKQVSIAIYRSLQLQRVYEQVCRTLEDAAIDFIPLKGSVIRKYYPQGWMRTSSDIDILIREADLTKAVDQLVKQGYQNEGRHSYDISLFSPNGMHLELHFNLITDYVSKSQAQVLAGLWERAVPVDGWQHHYEMPDDLFYFYHMAHMARHFQSGGCGVRSVLDTWLLNHRVDCDREARRQLLARGGLQVFAERMEQLSEIWFAGDTMNDICGQIADVILKNGVHGSYAQKITMYQAKKSGKLRYWCSRVFIPYERMKYSYPILKKHKWLLPFYQVARWFKLLFNGGVGRAAREVQASNVHSEQDRISSAELLKNLGLTDQQKIQR